MYFYLFLTFILFLLSTGHCASSDWDDAYGRKVFDLLFYTIGKTPDACLAKHFPAYQMEKTIKSDGDLIYKTAYVAISVSVDEQIIQISFRGSESYSTMSLNWAIAAISHTGLEEFYYGGQLAYQHHETWDKIYKGGLQDVMQDVWAKYCDFKLRIAGHSMGSCLGQALSLAVWKQGMWSSEDIELFSFGAPRCGDMDFALLVNKSAKKRFRVNNDSDSVPGSPGIGMKCSKNDNPTYPMYNNCYWHCCDALKYKNSTNLFGKITDSKILYCTHPEDTTCGTALLDLSMKNNFEFLGRTQPSEYGTISC